MRPVARRTVSGEDGPGRWRRAGAGLAGLILAVGLGAAGGSPAVAGAAVSAKVPRAECGPGSRPETGLQGQVPLKDRKSGRSKRGYECNLELVSRYQSQGQATVGAAYGTCQYLGTILPSAVTAKKRGVNVIDFKNPKKPKLTTSLVSPATLGGTWETLRVHEGRGLLAAVSVGAAVGGFFVSVYDVKTDCAHPRLLNGIKGTQLTMPGAFPGHEAAWSPDGRTYWTTGLVGGVVAALDMTNPRKPKVVFNGLTDTLSHGVHVSPDGNRLFIANSGIPAGISVFDSSEIQRRKPDARLRLVSKVSWDDGIVSQYAHPFTQNGRTYMIAVDELGSGGVRFFDLTNERRPKLVRKIKLEINRPEHTNARKADLAKNGIFGYDSHYCTMDRTVNPTALACGWAQSGIRVFDIRDLERPSEIAYFNPPAQVGRRAKLTNSAHAFVPFGGYFSDLLNLRPDDEPLYTGETDMTADWCMSPPRFAGSRLYVACDDNGALLLRFRNGVYPL
ncbi:hypothetical protein EDD29_3870 [Actinocorallia herbida]|uniref:LVIVD repeat-containing protein n=1 Tax=Actinocorallia herbida TaxID=58109 RepID=A0A3N1CYI9_9ACTN|nr:hypothetical protein [Actinocorallia herbida]ROO86306.1 hypothetical protein EDD29_3870 [Actinocorallia herbida]